MRTLLLAMAMGLLISSCSLFVKGYDCIADVRQEKKYIHKSCDDRRLVHPREACEWRIRILTPSEEDDDFYT